MNERVSPVADLGEKLESLKPMPRAKARVDEEIVAAIAEDNDFPSREARRSPKPPKRKPRFYKTGRNQNLHVKVTLETHDSFYRLATEKGVVMGELMRLALEAVTLTDSLREIADRRRVSLQQVVSEAVAIMTRAGD